jgi:hypothetical protein
MCKAVKGGQKDKWNQVLGQSFDKGWFNIFANAKEPGSLSQKIMHWWWLAEFNSFACTWPQFMRKETLYDTSAEQNRLSNQFHVDDTCKVFDMNLTLNPKP